MSYYRTQNFWGPGTNQLVKNNIFDEEKIIAGWPDHWRPEDYYPRCNCSHAEYAGQCDCLKDMTPASELNGLNSTNIHAAGFEPFGNQYEGFSNWFMWITVIITLLVLVGIIIGVWYYMKSKPEATQALRTATQAPMQIVRSAAEIPTQAVQGIQRGVQSITK